MQQATENTKAVFAAAMQGDVGTLRELLVGTSRWFIVGRTRAGRCCTRRRNGRDKGREGRGENGRDEEGKTPLIVASVEGQVEAIRSLLRTGADPIEMLKG